MQYYVLKGLQEILTLLKVTVISSMCSSVLLDNAISLKASYAYVLWGTSQRTETNEHRSVRKNAMYAQMVLL